jgi:hypothetical protein
VKEIHMSAREAASNLHVAPRMDERSASEDKMRSFPIRMSIHNNETQRGNDLYEANKTTI